MTTTNPIQVPSDAQYVYNNLLISPPNSLYVSRIHKEQTEEEFTELWRTLNICNIIGVEFFGVKRHKRYKNAIIYINKFSTISQRKINLFQELSMYKRYSMFYGMQDYEYWNISRNNRTDFQTKMLDYVLGQLNTLTCVSLSLLPPPKLERQIAGVYTQTYPPIQQTQQATRATQTTQASILYNVCDYYSDSDSLDGYDTGSAYIE
jgi:hypothetical protein